MRRHSNASSAGSKNRGTAGIVGLLVAAAALLGLAPSASAADRAYELVSPANKGGSDIFPEGSGGFFAPMVSENGNAVAYVSLNALPGSGPISNGAVNYYRSTRSDLGWAARQLSSILNPVGQIQAINYNIFSTDFRRSVQSGPATPAVTPDASNHALNLYRWNEDGFDLITQGLPEFSPIGPKVSAGSDGLDHIAFETEGGALNDESVPGVEPVLYDWHEETGIPKFVGFLPGEIPSPDPTTIANPSSGVFNFTAAQNWSPVSDDGSRIFFHTIIDPQFPTPLTQLYVRIDGTETKHVSESQRAIPDPLGLKAAIFRIASEDGSLVYFTSSEKLTDDATTGPTGAGEDLYRYEVASGELTDITVDVDDPNGAEVQGVIGAAEDGSRVYFVAKGVLDAGATLGENNLYVWTEDEDLPEGEITFIATGVGPENWQAEFGPQAEHVAGRVTSNGEHALFASESSLTGHPHAGFSQGYLYDAGEEELICATCNSEGTPSTANAQLHGTGDFDHFARTLSDDGQRVFFTTAEELVEADTNGVRDAYEFDVALNEFHLISTGQAQHDSMFADASTDGRDVIFATRQRLVGIDGDNNYDAYDARIGGGIASQNPPPPPPPCGAGSCQGPIVVVPPTSTPGSSTHSGPGNQKPKHKKHKKKKKKQQQKKRNGNGNRDGRR